MRKPTLSQKVVKIFGKNPNENFDKKSEELRKLLKPINHEISVGIVRGRNRGW